MQTIKDNHDYTKFRMKITLSKDTGLLLALTTSDQLIQLVYKTKQKALDALNTVDIELIQEPSYQKDNIMIITPKSENLKTKIKIDSEGKFTEDLTIPDFKDSDNFYKLACGKNAPFLILDDKYSSRRGATMIKYLERVESEFRNLYRKNTGEVFSLDTTKGIDHPINLMSLSDLVFKKLLSKADDRFYLREAKLAKNDNEFLKARDLTIIDQLDLPFTKNELENFVEARNAVMHFRVLTKRDALKIIGIVEKIQAYNWDRLLRDIVRSRENQASS